MISDTQSATGRERSESIGGPERTLRANPRSFWLLSAVLVAVPLILAPGLQFFDVTPKLLTLVAGACVVWIALAAGNGFPQFDASSARFYWLLAALAAAGVLATITSADPVISLVGSEWRRMGLPAWLACLALAAAVPAVVARDSSRRRQLAAILVVAAVVSSLYGFSQYLGYDPWIPKALYHIGEGEWQIVRPPSTLGHATYFAVFLVPAMFAAAGLALSAASPAGSPPGGARRKFAFGPIGWGAAAAVLALALLISGSRGAWVGAAAGGAVLFARVRQRRALLAGLLALSVLGALFVLSPAGRPVRSRIRWFVEDPAGGARLPLWRDSLRLALAHPLAGVGLDTFELSFPRVQSLAVSVSAPDRYAESPHNVFLDYMTAAGLPAALAFALLMALAMWNYARMHDAGSDNDGREAGGNDNPASLETGLLAGLAAGLVAGQFNADTIPTRLSLLVLAALSVSLPVTKASPPTIRSVRFQWARAAVAALAVGGLALVAVFGLRLIRADRAVWAASRAAAAGDLDRLLDAGRVARRSFPWSGVHDFAYSRLLGRIVMNPNLPPAQRGLLVAVAEDAARAALPHSSNPQMVQVHLASLHVIEGRQDEALAALEAAVSAAPGWYRPRWLLAVLLSERGRHPEAARQATAALERGARSHPAIAANCAAIQRLSSR